MEIDILEHERLVKTLTAAIKSNVLNIKEVLGLDMLHVHLDAAEMSKSIEDHVCQTLRESLT